MKNQQVLFVAFILAAVSTIVSAGVYDTVKICARLCSDGSTYTECIDTYGSASQADCHERISCPSPLTNVGWAYDLGESENLRFKELSQCQANLNNMRSKPNLPAIVDKKYEPKSFSLKKAQGPVGEAMQWHPEYDQYSEEEKVMLGRRIVAGNIRTRDMVYTDEEVREIGRRMFEFVREVQTVTTQSGVYTNGKCAGCSIIVQSIQKKLTASVCSSVTTVVTDVICKAVPPALDSFCGIILNAFEVDTLLTTLCEGAFSKAINATGIATRANLLCSTLTCLNQPDQVQSKSQITGICKIVKTGDTQRSLNERCDQLIRVCDMAEKGFCVATTIKELKEGTSSFVDAAAGTIAALVKGDVPPVVESVKKLAMECTGVKCGGEPSAARSLTPLGFLLVASVIVALLL